MANKTETPAKKDNPARTSGKGSTKAPIPPPAPAAATGLMARRPRTVFAVLAVLATVMVILAYSNHFENGFHFDDSHTIENNIYLRDLGNIPRFFTDGSTFSALPANQSYRPLVSATLALDYKLGNGLRPPFFFHLSTFVLFLFQGFLMYLLFLRVMKRAVDDRWSNYWALGATAFYMLNTSNAETINYIIARSDSLSTQGLLAGLVLYIYSPFCRRWLVYLVPVMIGMLAKPSAAMFAPILLAYIYLFEEPRSIPRAIQASIPAFVACAIGYLFISRMTPPTWTSGGASRYDYMISQPYIILHYVQTFLLPTWLSADTDWTAITTMAHPQFALGCVFVAFLVFAGLWAARQRRTLPIAFGLAWYLLASVPTTVVPLAEVMNDHRIFFPDVGLALVVGWIVFLAVAKYAPRLASSRFLRWSAVGALGLLFCGEAFATHERNKVWFDEETLWQDVTEKSPHNPRGLMNYGLTQMAKGRLPVAKKYFEDALPLAPRYAYLHVNMAILTEAMGNSAEAEKEFKLGIAYGAGVPDVYTFYSGFLMKHGRRDEAIPLLQKALSLSSASLDTRHALMAAYAGAGRGPELAALANETISMFPGDAQSAKYLRNGPGPGTPSLPPPSQQQQQPSPAAEASVQDFQMCTQQYTDRDFAGAVESCKRAIAANPQNADAYNNMCAAYNELKQWDPAVEACEKAIAIRPDYDLAKNNLRWAQDQLTASSQAPKAP